MVDTKQQPAGSIALLRMPGGKRSRYAGPFCITLVLAMASGLSVRDTMSQPTQSGTQVSPRYDLWIMPANDPSKAKRVTNSGEINGRFTWTPDGRVIFTSNVTGNPEIWIMKPDGTERKQLTNNPALDAQPAISSDGKHIIFTSDRAGGVKHIFRMDPDGSNVKQLTTGAHERLSAFSADGRWVYYVDGDKDPPFEPVREVYKVPVDGGGASLVVTAPEGWHVNGIDVNRADGRLVYGLQQRFENRWHFKLGILSAQGDKPRLMDVPTNLASRRPFWTPDGNSIALRSVSGMQLLDIWVLSADGPGQPRQLTHFKTFGAVDYDWSFDGKRLMISRDANATTPEQ